MQAITKEQMAELDRIMIEELGIDVPIMMEHAAVAVATAATKICSGKRILILCGHGNNGGDGLAAARHLMNWRYQVKVICSRKEKFKNDPLKQLNILQSMNADISFDSDINFSDFDLIIDALLGYNLDGDPRDVFADLIKKSNNSGVPILAVDLPSGLDANSGKAYDPCIKATATVALSVLKKGLVAAKKEYIGKLFVGYMSVPDSVYEKLGIKNPFTTAESLIEVD